MILPELVTATLVAFGVVFVAELGDKTQLLAMTFGSRYPLRRVALGLLVGYGAAGLIAVTVGQVLGANLPRRPIEVGGGVIFIVFGVLALRDNDDDRDGGGDGSDDDVDGEMGRTIVRSSVVATIALTILVAEMGDKTQIATATLAARSNPVATWIGATTGVVASGMIGAVAGTFVGDRISARTIRYLAAGLFILVGVSMLIGWS